MKLDDFLTRRWTPARILLISSVLVAFYFVLFFSWMRGGWKEVVLNHPVARFGFGFGREDDGLGDVGNKSLGFQKLFVVNMPARTDRRDACTLAFATSNIAVEFIDGVKGDSIPEEAFPPGNSAESIKLSKGIKGSWRGHMNALQQIVHENLTTAMIFEDDVDWDIRLRSQLQNFALASRLLSSPTFSNVLPQYDIQKSPNPETEESIHNSSSPNPIPTNLYSLPLTAALPSLPQIPQGSPYGDPSTWDVLWLGHCGVGFPRPRPHPRPLTSSNPSNLSNSNILLTHPSDPTVPSPNHLRAHPFGPLDALAESHDPHTRVYHRASGGALCTVAYAVSQRGARRLLATFGVERWARIWDAELGGWCAGSGSGSEEGEGEGDGIGTERICLTVQPPIFAHHHPAGGESNIGGLGGGYARSVETKYIRWSVRMNLGRLVEGLRKGEELVDQWPDEE